MKSTLLLEKIDLLVILTYSCLFLRIMYEIFVLWVDDSWNKHYGFKKTLALSFYLLLTFWNFHEFWIKRKNPSIKYFYVKNFLCVLLFVSTTVCFKTQEMSSLAAVIIIRQIILKNYKKKELFYNSKSNRQCHSYQYYGHKVFGIHNGFQGSIVYHRVIGVASNVGSRCYTAQFLLITHRNAFCWVPRSRRCFEYFLKGFRVNYLKMDKLVSRLHLATILAFLLT